MNIMIVHIPNIRNVLSIYYFSNTLIPLMCISDMPLLYCKFAHLPLFTQSPNPTPPPIHCMVSCQAYFSLSINVGRT